MACLDKDTHKKKNCGLLSREVLLVDGRYKRAFKITIETLGVQKELIQKIEYAKHVISDIRTTQKDIAYLNKLLGKENVTIEKVQQSFLDFFEKNSNQVVVYQVDEVLVYKHPDFSVNTHRIILKGSFLPTLRFLYQLEKDFDLAQLINVSFEFKKYNSEEKEQLYTTILLQNYER